MFWLFAATIAGTFFVQILRWTQHARGDLAWTAMVNYAVAAVFFCWVYTPWHREDCSWTVTLIGILAGVLYLVNLAMIAAMIRRLGLALASAVTSIAMVAPLTVSVAFGDPWLDRLPGLLVALLAAPMLAMARCKLQEPQSLHGLKRAVWMGGFFLTMGIEQSLVKIARQVGDQGFERSFLPALFVTAFVCSIPWVLNRWRRPRTADLLRGIALGGCNIASNLCFALSLLVLSGTVAFPIRHVVTVAATALLGFVIWREKPDTVGIVGIALSLVAVVLLTI